MLKQFKQISKRTGFVFFFCRVSFTRLQKQIGHRKQGGVCRVSYVILLSTAEGGGTKDSMDFKI